MTRRMIFGITWLVVGTGLVLLALVDIYDYRHKMVELFGGKDAIAVVAHPSRVQAFRLVPHPESGNRYVEPTDYSTSQGPREVPTSASNKIASVLTSGRSFDWDEESGCFPKYGVRLSFYRGEDKVDVYLCYSCNQLAVARGGKVVGGRSFHGGRPALIEAAKEIFPDDPEIQMLDPRRPFPFLVLTGVVIIVASLSRMTLGRRKARS